MTTTTPSSPITAFLDALHDHLSHYHDERSQTLQLKLSTLRRELRQHDANLNQNILDRHREIQELQAGQPGIPVPAARARLDEPTADPCRAALTKYIKWIQDDRIRSVRNATADHIIEDARALLARPEAPPAPLWAAYAGSALGDDLSLHRTRREALEAVCSTLGLDDADELDPEDVRLNADLDDDELAERISAYCEGRADDWCVSEVEVPK